MLIVKAERGGLATWKCDECLGIFYPMGRRANEAKKNNHNMYCSSECRKKNWKRTATKRLKIWDKDTERPTFKAGISISTDGYIQIRVVGKPKNIIKLHRYLMEIKIGRPLKSSEIVHHINEDRFDNKIENLQIVTRSQHNKIHKFLCKKGEVKNEKEMQ